jgi:hypothetical protein
LFTNILWLSLTVNSKLNFGMNRLMFEQINCIQYLCLLMEHKIKTKINSPLFLFFSSSSAFCFNNFLASLSIMPLRRIHHIYKSWFSLIQTSSQSILESRKKPLEFMLWKNDKFWFFQSIIFSTTIIQIIIPSPNMTFILCLI